jgi:hypothetical protein
VIHDADRRGAIRLRVSARKGRCGMTFHPSLTHPEPPHSHGPRPLLRLLIDHNPFYILSGALMLLGCYLVSVDTHGQVDVVRPLIWLVAIMLTYQAAVLGLGLWLTRFTDVGTRRDTMQLLIVWLVLALDAAMLHHELMVRSPAAGAALATIACLWTLAGVAAIGRAMRLRLSAIAWGLIATDVLLVFVVPGWYRWIASAGFLPDLTEFRAAWLLGLWIAAHALAPEWSRRARRSPALQWSLLALPCVSLIAHVYVANWTFSRHGSEAFDAHHLIPLLLGVAAILARAGRSEQSRTSCRASAIAAGCVAVGLSMAVSPPCPRLYWPWMDAMPIHLQGLALTGFAALLLWTWLHHGGAGTLIGGYMCAVAAGWIHMPPSLGRLGRDLARWVRRIVPDEGADWGVLAILGAFVTLVLGAGMSLWSRRRPPGE